jgi:hypothetical protein
MHPFVAAAPTLAVCLIFNLWNIWRRTRIRREAVLRSRVAYMLWVIAEQM